MSSMTSYSSAVQAIDESGDRRFFQKFKGVLENQLSETVWTFVLVLAIVALAACDGNASTITDLSNVTPPLPTEERIVEMAKAKNLDPETGRQLQKINANTGNLEDDLKAFNRIEVPADEQIVVATGDGAISVFENYKFTCKKQKDFSPEESAEAKKSLNAFLSFFVRYPSPTVEQKKQRLALMAEAIKAGSWRAKYIDLIWKIWDERGNQKALIPLSKQMVDMASEGIPIVIFGYVEFNADLQWRPADRYNLLKEAIERGNPNAMNRVAWNIGIHSLKLRPMAKKMLDCAVQQDEPGAYYALGEFARREGRLVDAYRLWETGANKGCEDCIGQMEQFSKLNPGFRISDGTTNSNQTLNALKKFYSGQFVYQITKMSELLEKAPARMEFHVTDQQIIDLIKMNN